MRQDDPLDISFVQKPSRTQRKNELEDLKVLGAELVDMPAGKLAKLELPDDLRAAVSEARRLKVFAARRRQLQLISRLMEGIDAAALRAAIDAVDHGTVAKLAAPAVTEPTETQRLAGRLLDEGDDAVFALSYEREQLQTLRQVVRQGRKQIEKGIARATAVSNVASCLARLSELR